MHLKTEADIIGINNRNLDTLEIDLKTTESVLFEKLTQDLKYLILTILVDIQYLKKSGANAFLIGSSIMKSDNIEEQVRKLVNSI